MLINDKIVKTAKGYPAIWEEGGGMTNTGNVFLVTGERGEKLEPIYIKKHGPLSCSQHALFLLKSMYHVIHVERFQDDYKIKIYQYEDGVLQEVEAYPYLQPAINKAKEKSRHYHCRAPYYLIQKEELCEASC